MSIWYCTAHDCSAGNAVECVFIDMGGKSLYVCSIQRFRLDSLAKESS